MEEGTSEERYKIDIIRRMIVSWVYRSGDKTRRVGNLHRNLTRFVMVQYTFQ